MGRHLAARDVAQFVLQRFGENLHARLRQVVGRIARRRRDALLRSGVDDHRRSPAGDHAGRERLAAVNDAPQVDVDDAPPRLPVAKRSNCPARSRRCSSARRPGRTLRSPPVSSASTSASLLTSVGAASTALRAIRRSGGDFARRPGRAARPAVGDDDIEPHRREPLRRRQADARSAAGDDRAVSRIERSVAYHCCLLSGGASAPTASMSGTPRSRRSSARPGRRARSCPGSPGAGRRRLRGRRRRRSAGNSRVRRRAGGGRVSVEPPAATASSSTARIAGASLRAAAVGLPLASARSPGRAGRARRARGAAPRRHRCCRGPRCASGRAARS